MPLFINSLDTWTSLSAHIQYIDILYNHWHWHWHWHLWVDESKTCGIVSKAWVNSTQFGSKGGEKGGEKRWKVFTKLNYTTFAFPNHWGDQDTTVEQQHKQQRVERLPAWASRNKFEATKGAKIRAHALGNTESLSLLHWAAFTVVQRTFLHNHCL